MGSDLQILAGKHASSSDAAIQGAWISVTPTLNLRAQASDKAKILKQLKRGDTVRVITPTGFWWKVESNGINGFVAGKYLNAVAGAEPEVRFLYSNARLRAVSITPEAKIPAAKANTAAKQTCARAWNAMGGLIAEASELLQIDPGAAVAVFCVESGGRTSDEGGRMVIRFENHIFFNRWGEQNRRVVDRHFRFNAEERWKGHLFSKPGNGQFKAFHGDQAEEWKVLGFARTLDDEAALDSISMGPTQVMGFNSNTIGYPTARTMFEQFQADFRFQVIAFFDFVKGPTGTSRTLKALQTNDYLEFANNYNGPGQAAQYADLIRQHAEAFAALRA